MEEYSGYVGLDVHKDRIAVAVALPGRSEPKSLGMIANSDKSLLKLISRLSPNGEVLGFCYEAGACGNPVYRWIKQTCQDCEVVAPSKIPTKAGERVKTDRRDAVKLASLHRTSTCGDFPRALKRCASPSREVCTRSGRGMAESSSTNLPMEAS